MSQSTTPLLLCSLDYTLQTQVVKLHIVGPAYSHPAWRNEREKAQRHSRQWEYIIKDCSGVTFAISGNRQGKND